jgi:hypothetical protein
VINWNVYIYQYHSQYSKVEISMLLIIELFYIFYMQIYNDDISRRMCSLKLIQQILDIK